MPEILTLVLAVLAESEALPYLDVADLPSVDSDFSASIRRDQLTLREQARLTILRSRLSETDGGKWDGYDWSQR